MRLIAATATAAAMATADDGDPTTLAPPNDADVLALDLRGVRRIDLAFPTFTDGRALSQAARLRQRGWAGTLRAVGDVRADHLLAMRRVGFDEAVLAPDEPLGLAQQVLDRTTDVYRHGFYQGDAREPRPRFARRADAGDAASAAPPTREPAATAARP